MISADVESDLKIQRMQQGAKKRLTIAKPTSAFFNAGPSLVPSPVTATTCLWSTMVLSMIPTEQMHKSKTRAVRHIIKYS